ncbi:hypothetical protein SARC_01738 [Sphaeroforma arctica JP610]|uniref:Uncharacterized protein n=1 Tax=Sphaeroforma arctica JP610 TaxID=667725 RepID=A0A0L0GAU4_9EUKA|nr:hypothetical protein SARC_01738 [Sphaeroforma arctica JP610]KNC86122.1 hypothetical protein SARC_01738 [Sphaeroforma arctica JP610]|eukprot:XP_014160024.1 hypothetical protein SARC_01738 [Sphaeroforma arctica JP610]
MLASRNVMDRGPPAGAIILKLLSQYRTAFIDNESIDMATGVNLFLTKLYCNRRCLILVLKRPSRRKKANPSLGSNNKLMESSLMVRKAKLTSSAMVWGRYGYRSKPLDGPVGLPVRIHSEQDDPTPCTIPPPVVDEEDSRDEDPYPLYPW